MFFLKYTIKGKFYTNRFFICVLLLSFLLMSFSPAFPQYTKKSGTDSDTPLHLLKPEYEVPYGIPKKESIIKSLGKVYGYLEGATPVRLIDAENKLEGYPQTR